MKPSYALMAILFIFTFSASARAQVAPAATGPAGLGGSLGPPVNGMLQYSLNYAQTAQFYGGTQGGSQTSGVNGQVTFITAKAHPFALTYSGGDMWTISGAGEGSGVFQHLMVSQGFVLHSWAFNLNDNVSYTPQAPTMGFSGIPGVGSLPGAPGAPTQPILTLNTRSVNNQTGANFTHGLGHATSLGVNGSYGILRYPDGNGLETNSLQAGPQITRRLNALNSITGQYSFSSFSYPGSTITMETQSAMAGYQRTWSRRLNTSVSAGPEWIQGSAGSNIPSSTDLTVNANMSYAAKSGTATLSYTQAASGGAGVTTQVGVNNKDISAALSRQQGKNLSLSVTGSYMRTGGLQQTGVTNAEYGGVSATRRLGRYIVASANYTAIYQSTSSSLPANAVSGLSQVIGFSLGFSPREKRFKK
jgi:hypothetical protein